MCDKKPVELIVVTTVKTHKTRFVNHDYAEEFIKNALRCGYMVIRWDNRKFIYYPLHSIKSMTITY